MLCCMMYDVWCVLYDVCCVLYDVCCVLCAVCSLQTVQTTPKHVAPVANCVFYVSDLYFLLLRTIWSRRTERTVCPVAHSSVTMRSAVGRPAGLYTRPSRSGAPVTERFALYDDLLYLHFALNLSLRLTSNVPAGAQ